MVTTWGRMGTTWFLRILREHPEIVVHGPYPYETRAAVYWAHMLKVLAEPSSTIEEFHVDGAKVGRHPVNALHPTERYLHEWFASDYAHDLTLLSATSIDRFYSSVAKAIGRPEARYFAEKVLPTHGPRVLWSLYPDAKEIILIRDLRDVVCSIRAFNAQRGFAAFGEEHAKNDAEFIEFLRSAAFRLMAAWRERSSRALLLRYEDLILSPVESIQKVLGYLELDASAQVAQELLAAAEVASSSMRGHVTAGTPEASVGRWRRDLDPSLAELCQQAFEEILKTFDYPIALDKTHAPV
ncbi:MAG: sulfotransferase family protein [Gammaproteobacteria bacterium]